MSTIADRIAHVRARIAEAAEQAGRRPADITLVTVTKTHPPERIAEAIAAGSLDLGENRVQEAIAKIATLAADHSRLRWHLIGHLQRNKARVAVESFDLIHSVDSLRLAETLNRHASDLGRRLAILLQLNVSGEASKEGFDLSGGLRNHAALDQFLPQIEAILALPALEICGLMTIAPIVEDLDAARPVFAELRTVRDELARRYPNADWHALSMGMTDDFPAAIAEGATIVRVGRAIFGERP
ncbi:MAG: YggS family pyridoxal phosphate-dependent enzyme [Oscillochloris sp.]|nr:YggS family pyridoxal phosphate-dependent enzyme [Oscillochloris sp.]